MCCVNSSPPGRRVICLVGAGISTCKHPLPQEPPLVGCPWEGLGRSRAGAIAWEGRCGSNGAERGPSSLAPCPQPRASLTSAPRPRASMPTWRSTVCPTRRPSLRLATSRYESQGTWWGPGAAWCQLSPHQGHGAACPPVSLPQKHPEPFFALAKELYPGQFKVSSFRWGGQERWGTAGLGRTPPWPFRQISSSH